MVVNQFWGDRVTWVEFSGSKDGAKQRAKVLRNTEGIGRVRVFNRTVRAGGAKASVWVVVCHEAKGASDVE